MKAPFYHTLLWIALTLVVGFPLLAQDFRKETRVEKSNSVAIFGGAALPLTGNYRPGPYAGAAFYYRYNQFISFGAGIEYSEFQVIADSESRLSLDNGSYVLARHLSGGDLRFINIGVPFKLNLLPLRRSLSPYLHGFPCLMINQKSKVEGYDRRFTPSNRFEGVAPWTQESFQNDYKRFDRATNLTVALGLGAGIDFNATQTLGGFIQGNLFYTLPIDYIDTSNYENINTFPIGSSFGFTTLQIKAGITLNF